MNAAVIVPTVLGGPRLERLLDSLARQTTVAPTIVVDNASRGDEVEKLVARYEFAQRVRLEENAGFGRAVNLAARRAEAGTLVFLNDDCICEPRFVEEIAGALATGDGVVMAAGVLVDAREPDTIDTAGMEVDGTLLVFDYLNGEPVSSLGAATPDPIGPCGAAAAFDRDVFLELGGFDERLFAYWEDVDLVLRLRGAGGRCVLARDARGAHEHSGTLGSGSRRKNYLVGFGRGYVLRKWSVLHSPVRAAQTIVEDSAICAGQLLLDGNLAGARGRWDGYRAAAAVETYPYPKAVLPRHRRALATLGARLRRRLRLRARQ